MDPEDAWPPSADLLRDYQDPGTPPGTLRPAEGQRGPARVVVASYSADQSVVADAVAEGALEKLRGDGRIHWVHVIGLGDVALIERLGKIFELHPLALEDVLTLGQRPKTEAYDQTVFCTLQLLSYANGDLTKTQLSLFLGDDFVITFQAQGDDFLSPVRDRIANGRARLRHKGACYLAYALIDLVVDAAFPALEAFGAHLDDIEEEILEQPDRSDLEKLQGARRDLLVLRQVLWPQREVMGHLARQDHDLMPEDVRIYFRDCYDHAVQALEVSENFREMASGLLDIYLTSLSHKLNDVMKVLTMISTIFMPLSFLAGVYGMNFDTSQPLNMPELHSKYGYVGFWSVSLAAVATMIWLFRKRGWL